MKEFCTMLMCCIIMHSKSSLLDELVKRVNRNVQADHTDIEDDNGDYTSDEEEFNDGLPK